MAVESPMSNFNRKNPYVIQTKQQYNKLMQMYETVSKSILISAIIILSCFIISLIFSIILHDIIRIIESCAILIAYLLYTYDYIKNTIKDDINTDIDKMVTLESNEIMNIDITYVQDILYKVHNRIGKVEVYIKVYYIRTILLLAFGFILVII